MWYNERKGNTFLLSANFKGSCHCFPPETGYCEVFLWQQSSDLWPLLTLVSNRGQEVDMVHSNKYIIIILLFSMFKCHQNTGNNTVHESQIFPGFSKSFLFFFLGLEVGKYGKSTLVFPVDAEPETLSGTTRSLSTWRSQIMSAFMMFTISNSDKRRILGCCWHCLWTRGCTTTHILRFNLFASIKNWAPEEKQPNTMSCAGGSHVCAFFYQHPLDICSLVGLFVCFLSAFFIPLPYDTCRAFQLSRRCIYMASGRGGVTARREGERAGKWAAGPNTTWHDTYSICCTGYTQVFSPIPLCLLTFIHQNSHCMCEFLQLPCLRLYFTAHIVLSVCVTASLLHWSVPGVHIRYSQLLLLLFATLSIAFIPFLDLCVDYFSLFWCYYCGGRPNLKMSKSTCSFKRQLTCWMDGWMDPTETSKWPWFMTKYEQN